MAGAAKDGQKASRFNALDLHLRSPCLMLSGTRPTVSNPLPPRDGSIGSSGQHHSPDALPEIAAAIDSPMLVEPDRLVRGVDHVLGWSGQHLEGSVRQPPVAGRVSVECGSIGFGERASKLIEHGRLGGSGSLCHET